MSGKAEVRYDATYILPQQIANRIQDLGFEATVIEEGSGEGVLDLHVSQHPKLLYPQSDVTSLVLLFFIYYWLVLPLADVSSSRRWVSCDLSWKLI